MNIAKLVLMFFVLGAAVDCWASSNTGSNVAAARFLPATSSATCWYGTEIALTCEWAER